MMEYAIAQIKNERVALEAQNILGLLNTDQISASQSFDMIQSLQKSSFNNGASWNGVATISTVSAVILIAVVIVAAKTKCKSTTRRDQNCWSPAN